MRKQNAATTLQNAIRTRTAKRDMMKQRQRVKPQNNIKKIKQTKEIIGAKAKRLLTRMVESFYGEDSKRTYITNKDKVGQCLVVNKRKQLGRFWT